jgi:hypothetical protein
MSVEGTTVDMDVKCLISGIFFTIIQKIEASLFLRHRLQQCSSSCLASSDAPAFFLSSFDSLIQVRKMRKRMQAFDLVSYLINMVCLSTRLDVVDGVCHSPFDPAYS